MSSNRLLIFSTNCDVPDAKVNIAATKIAIPIVSRSEIKIGRKKPLS
jgi:hypothetical protein